jgi:amino acid adenylation domain-containing protein/non-ribosomal peptide synthase protein (TIGR01720 family)
VPAARGARIDELLLAAFAWALARFTGSPTVLFDREGHGREELAPGVDLTRTIGWFTTLHPVVVEVADRAPADVVAAVQRALAAAPHGGIGYGLLRRLRPDTRAALAALPAAQVGFNYLGQLDRALPASAPLVPAPEPAGPDRSPAARRTHLVEVNAWVGAGRLHAAFTYGERRHRRATIEALAASFVEALRAVLAPAQADPGIEARYPLTPLQEGILFHARTAPQDPVYLVQTSWTMEGVVDAKTFAAALQDLVDRHAALRTSFAWEGLAAPEQRVHTTAALPIAEVDLRALAPDARSTEVERREAEDRARPFDPTRAPLMRVTLLRLGDDALRVVWTLHHVLVDGWSMPILLDELFALHEARRAGRAALLEPPPAFRAYVAWLGEQDRARSTSFWRRELEGFVAPTALGVDRPVPRDDGGPRAGWQRLSLDEGATEALLAFAQRSKLTPSTVVQGAWALLLARYGGEDDVVFGAAVSGRSAPIPGIWRMVGLLINTLPVRVRTPWDAPVEAWLADLQVHLAELREHEHSPLVEILAASDLPRGAPLFESLVVFENYPVKPAPHASAGGVPARGEGGLAITEAGHFDDPPYPLTLLAAHRGALHLELGYDRRRVDDDAAARAIGHLATLLAAIAERPGARLGELSLLAADERRALLAAGNDTAAAYPREACLHHLFAARAQASPDAPALLHEGRTVLYRELAARAQAVTGRLRALGVGRSARVGICAERSPETVAAILGVLAAGAAYVPLDPGYPRDRLAFMIEDAHLDVVLASAAGAARLPEGAARVEPLEGDAPAVAAAPPAEVTSAEAAYVIYTSGSTGRPKGVVGTHRGMVNRCAWMWQRYPFRPFEVCCHKTSTSFVDSLWEIFGPLLQGVPALILPDDAVHDLSRFVAALASARVSRLVLVPSLLAALLDVAPDLGARLPDLAQVTSSGEALTAELAARFHRALPGRTLLDIYGSSEVSADATCAEVPSDLSGGVTIGTPIANTRAHVLDPAGHPAPIGVPGELCVGGDGLALGYLERPELTAERFVPDPFSAEPGARLFRTGDRARRRASGEIELVGRRDDQVKVRGVRVEPGEVRAALLDHPAVREAAVAARADGRGELRLVAYVVARDEKEAKPAALAAFLRERLPAPMVPSAFVMLEALPLLPNGKLDRRALPAPESAAGLTGFVAPRDALEAEIAAVWAEVLGVERVSVVANFFDLGGHSLLLARVHDRLAARSPRPVSLVDLLAHPTVASLSRLLGGPVEETREASAAEERARRRRAAARRARGGDRG